MGEGENERRGGEGRDEMEVEGGEKKEVGVGVSVREGLRWFDEMKEESRLGRVRKQWGVGRSGDGRYKVEWEVVEWRDDDSESESVPAKRKIGEVEEAESMER